MPNVYQVNYVYEWREGSDPEEAGPPGFICNEMTVVHGTSTLLDINQWHMEFVSAIRAVEPGALFIGPEAMTGASALGIHGVTDWMLPFLQDSAVAASIEALSWRYYPLWSGQGPGSSAYPTMSNLLQEAADDWRPAGLSFADEVMPILLSRRDQYAPGAQIWITEIAEDSGTAASAGLGDVLGGALWVADVKGRYLAWGVCVSARCRAQN